MDFIIYSILQRKISTQECMSIKVSGNSMYPILSNGDVITLFRENKYIIGDILAFWYKNELIVHRLLKTNNELYFCKGDNSFRIESVQKKFVIGKVILINSKPVPTYSNSYVSLFCLVNREFCNLCYDVDKTQKTAIYKFYRQALLNVVDNTLEYQIIKNDCTDIIPSNNLECNAQLNVAIKTMIDLLKSKKTYWEIVHAIQAQQSIDNKEVEYYTKEALTYLVSNQIVTISTIT